MFLHPWAIILGLLAAGLPVLIHWLTKPRPRPVMLSTLRFVREVVQQRKARHRLRDIIILTLRTAAVALLAFAIARPLMGTRQSVPLEDGANRVRIVLVDVSQSLAAESRGIQAFERGRPLAMKHFEYADGLSADLVLAGARATAIFGRPSTNLAALREEISRAAPRPEALNVQNALNVVSEAFTRAGGSEGMRKELFIISDFQRSNWAQADFSTLPADTVIELEPVGSEQTQPNLAVMRVASPSRLETGREARLEVDVGNYSSTPQRAKVDVSLGDAVYQLEGTCPPGATTTLTTEIVPRTLGWQTGQAKVVAADDALPADNIRPCAFEVRPPPVLALVTRESATMRPSSSYYLERGLSPMEAAEGRAGMKVVRLNPSELDREALGLADVIAIDHPGRLDAATIGLFSSLMRRGRGILYIASEPIDATNLKLLADTAGSGLRIPVEFTPPPAGQSRRDLFLADARKDQSPFLIFGDDLPAVIGPLRFSGGLASRRLEGGLDEDILATYNDRTACLIATSSEAGSIVVLNADLTSSNLPGSALFVTMLGELTQRLLGQTGSKTDFHSGEPLTVSLPSTAGASAGLKVVGPTPTEEPIGSLTQDSSGVYWQADVAGAPGVYRVQRGNETVFALATTLPPEESDLRVLTSDVFEKRLAGERQVHYRTQNESSAEEKDSLWTWLAAACLMCVLGEVVALKVLKT